jgi:uncharacterized membrane protein (DUF4010 family)
MTQEPEVAPTDMLLADYGSLAVALGIGLMIGLQRAQAMAAEQQEVQANGDVASGRPLGGIRTYPLIALAGAISSLLGGAQSAIAFVVSAAFVLTLVTLSYLDDLKRERQRGLTTESAILLTFLLGALAASESVLVDDARRWLLAASSGVVITAILSLKQRLHSIAARISRQDMYATLKFAVVAVVIVPLLPDRDYGPTEDLAVLNPYRIGWMVLLVAAISFVGYVAVRLLGPGRGLGITGLVGGLASSTAVTLALANRSKEHAALGSSCAFGVVLANLIMPIRVLVVTAVIHAPLALRLAPPLVAATVVGAGVALLMRSREARPAGDDVDLHLANPFELGPALKFGALFAAVLFVTRLAQIYLGDRGLYATGLIAGVTDIDAITLSMGSMSRSAGGDGHGLEVAALTILLAALSNTAFKAGLAAFLGSPSFRRMTVLALFAMAAAGVVAFLALPALVLTGS